MSLKKRPLPFDEAAYAEGNDARKRGASYDECPYFFGTLKVPERVFERDYRAKMNGWTFGWIEGTQSDSPPSEAEQPSNQ
jgi:hypothetical protein